MADVGPSRGPPDRGSGPPRRIAGSDGDRGQLFVVTALTLGVLFVVLALLLNTAIFTENLATRSTDPGVADAIEFRGSLEESVGDVVVATNQRYDTTEGTLANGLETELANWSELALRQSIADGHAPSVTVDSVAEWGGQVVQNDSTRTFTDAAGDEDWDVVLDAEQLRSFNMTVRQTGLASADRPDETTTSGFWVELSGDGGDTWRLFATDNSTDADDYIDLHVRTGGTVTMCTDIRERASIDLVGGVANGSCSFTSPLSVLSTPIDVRFVNGGDATGRYRIAQRQDEPVDADGQETELETAADFEDEFSDPYPSLYATELIWTVRVDVIYRGPDVHYEGEVSVTP